MSKPPLRSGFATPAGCVIRQMNNSKPRIKVIIKGRQLLAFLAISQEFDECGKVSNISQVSNLKEEKQFKFNETDFTCVYNGIVRALNGPRYPSKTGNEYQALCRLKEYFESEYKEQRNDEI